MDKIKLVEVLPMLALRGLSAFPHMLLHFDVERKMSVKALNRAMEGDRRIFLLTQKDVMKSMPGERDLYRTGTICNIRQVLRMKDGTVRVMVEGVSRGRLRAIIESTDFYLSEVEVINEPDAERATNRTEALIRQSHSLLEQYIEVSSMPYDKLVGVYSSVSPGYIADYICQNISLKYAEKQKILEELNPVLRLSKINKILAREIEILHIEIQLNEKVQSQMAQNQRDFVLREQLKAIRSELGESDDFSSELEEYAKKIWALKLPAESREKLQKELSRLSKQGSGSSEAAVIRTYLDTCLELPWNRSTRERVDIKAARAILDADHFGLEKVKERIIEFLAVKQLAPDVKGAILCLVGPPGVGKTSVATSVAKALNLKLARISLGGVHDEAEIRGHRKTYVGAMPGRIIAAVRQAGTNNPLLLFDEIDKLGRDHRGDPSSALLEVFDVEQNHAFRDHYVELPFDLSNAVMITTANKADTIPRPLLDRMEIIELSSYTDEEKLQIAVRHLLSKQRKKHGLNGRKLRLSDEVIREIISGYTRESGVRQLERELAKICRKTAAGIASGEYKTVTLTSSMLESFLGVRKYKPEALQMKDEVGTVRGLAWTAHGGEILEVEVGVLPGSGKLELTGNLGEVMKESALAAVSYIRSRAGSLGIDPDFYKNKDIHIHFPESAIPKDGPSAGITMCIAVISALTGAPVRRDIAMTGEITLRGRIMAIGGLKEKAMAALRAGIRTVIIPAENEADLSEIDQTVRSALNFVVADHIDNILGVCLDFDRRSDVNAMEVELPLASARSSGTKIPGASKPPAKRINQ